jgi:undecaprenyl diphosphate synthase
MEQLNPEKLPRHVAIIMDGNGRWAKKKGLTRIIGHQNGIKSVKEVVKTTRELGIDWLTLYAFSEENWKRSKYEIKALMDLLKRYLKSELKEMLENGIRLLCIGQIDKLPLDVQKILWQTIEKTAHNKEMTLNLALSYGSRQEIIWAIKNMLKDVERGVLNIKQITGERFSSYLFTADAPDPDLLIRTSGEYRVSNFLLWQAAYSELYFCNTYWPAFSKKDLEKAIIEFNKRNRRFGGLK